jgi:hypothetical protein
MLFGQNDHPVQHDAEASPAVPLAANIPPYNVAVVIPTIGRQTLERAVHSVYSQDLPGTIQLLIGVDVWKGGDRGRLNALAQSAPTNRTTIVFDPGYSTSFRHGGFTASGDGGALRTILSYVAHSRLVAYLDDDNWWAPEHLSLLVKAIAGHDWAFSLRWFVDPETARPLCIDSWESVGPGAGVFAGRFGGFVDPSCLMIDKVKCEAALRLWCHPLQGDRSGMTSDRSVFAYLHIERRSAGSNQATAYYTLNAADVNHGQRLEWIAQATAHDSLPITPHASSGAPNSS